MSNWQDKTCVVTGAASGIGAAIVRYALQQGMRVVAADIDTEALQAAHQSLHGRHLLLLRCDVSDEASVQALAEQTFQWAGTVSLLFNNAGIMLDGKSWERSAADWRKTLDVNVLGVVHGIRAFVPRMLAQGQPGRIINTSSIGGLLGGAAYMGLYQGSKHMVTAISESLYQELALEEAAISVSVLCPAEVATAIAERSAQPATTRDKAAQAFHTMLASGIRAGLDPDALAPLVFAGIEKEQFWLLPQAAFKPLLQQRCEQILLESNPGQGLASMLER